MHQTLLQTARWLRIHRASALRGHAYVAGSRNASSNFDIHAFVPVGKHKGRTYEDIIENEKQYIDWLKKSDSGGRGPFAGLLAHLAQTSSSAAPTNQTLSSTSHLGTEVITFGKHRGKTFDEVLVEDASYAKFVTRSVQDEGSKNPQMKRFAEFLEKGSQPNAPAATRPDGGQSAQSGLVLKRASWEMKSGKHKGKSFQDVYQEDKSYCEWATKTAASGDAGGGLVAFAEYVKARDAEPKVETAQPSSTPVLATPARALSMAHKEVTFGKHKGKTFEAVFLEDARYCEWVLKSAADETNCNPRIAEFADFIKAKADGPSDASPVETPQAKQAPPSSISMPDQETEAQGPMPIDEYKVVEGLQRGRSFKDVFDKEQDYCRWLVEHYFDNGLPGAPQWHFVAYIVNRWRLGDNAPPTFDDE